MLQDTAPRRPGEVRTPLQPLREVPASGSDCLLPLIAEAVRASEPVLVFCASRKQCQNCAQLAARLLPQHLGPDFQVLKAPFTLSLSAQASAQVYTALPLCCARDLKAV